MLRCGLLSLVTFLIICSTLSAQGVQERSDTIRIPGSDSVRVRNIVGGKMFSEYYFVKDRVYRFRDYIYSDTSYGYFQYEITGRVTQVCVFYEFALNDTLITIAEYYKRKYDGRVQTFYPNGNRETDSQYKMDKLEGIQYEYHENGQTSFKCNYTNNQPNGYLQMWYANGNPEEECNAVYGKYEDTAKYYYQNGQLKTIIVFKHDLPWEVVSTFDQDGNVLDKGTLKNGTGTLRNYDQFGMLEDYDVYKDGKYVESWEEVLEWEED